VTAKPGDQRELDEAVRVRRARRELGRHDGERSLAQNLALAGVLGWTIVLPSLAGILLGRWLDRMLGTGIVLTSALLFIGVVVGCAFAWRRIHQ
jgi:ATP synthase protein I